MKNKKVKGFYATLEPFKKKVVKYLQSYYFQDGAWHKQEELSKGGKKNERRKSA